MFESGSLSTSALESLEKGKQDYSLASRAAIMCSIGYFPLDKWGIIFDASSCIEELTSPKNSCPFQLN